MAIPVILPKFGFTQETADLVQWLVKEGDTVRAGDPIAEVTTEKVNMEVEAPEDGTIYGFKYSAGVTLPVTEVICFLARPGEAVPTGEAPTPVAAPESAQSAQANSVNTATPLAKRIAETSNVALESVQGSGRNGKIMRRDVEALMTPVATPDTTPQIQPQQNGKVRATPAARALAAEHTIDLGAINGTGPSGRVQRADVENYVESRAQNQAMSVQADPVTVQSEIVPVDASMPALQQVQPTVRQIPLEGVRKVIANRLQKSFQTAPHIFFDAAIDMTQAEALRSRYKARNQKLSLTAIIARACTWALRKHEYVNATLENEIISLHESVNLGVAVALDNGLIVPVIHRAESLDLPGLQSALDGQVEKAKANRLGMNDVSGGTFTISNLGMYGVDRFTAIINPPQVAILAVGRTVRQFVPDEAGNPVVRPIMNVTVSADHRVIDGAQVALFLADLRSALEDPLLLL